MVYSFFISVLLAVSYCLLGSGIPGSVIVWGVSVGVLYSILPDLDARNSRIRQFVTVFFILCSVLYVLYPGLVPDMVVVALVFLLAVTFLSKHRGFFHTPAAAVLFSLPLAIVDPWLSLFGFLGFLSHLAVDGKLPG